jgi:hypothetical protein
MTRNHEKLLVAALCGLIIAGAAAYAVGPVLASDAHVGVTGHVSGLNATQVLNVRMSPEADAWTVGSLEPQSTIWIDRCTVDGEPRWCLVEQGETFGWVRADFISLAGAAH